jgi:uncharacterized protein (TIGR02391 family)
VSSIIPRQTTSFSNRNDDQYAQVAGKYVHEKSPSYYLELGANGNYVLFEGTEVIGTYEVNGAAMTLFVARRPTSTAKIEGGSIIDEQGDRWVRATVPTAASQPEKQYEPVMGTDLTQTLPTADSVLELEPEALGGYLLESLSTDNSQDLRLDNFISRIRAHYKQDAVNNALLEAWAWLVREGLLIATKDDTYLISRRGRKLKGRQDLEAYRKSNILPKESLHPVIADRVWPNFIRGEYETAVFQAFKEVEVAVRTAGGFQATDIGTDLIEKAFDYNSGPLTDTTLPQAERQAMLALFSGAVGLFKNPSSHRHITLNDPKEAAEMISLASLLMRTVDSRKGSTKTKKNS